MNETVSRLTKGSVHATTGNLLVSFPRFFPVSFLQYPLHLHHRSLQGLPSNSHSDAPEYRGAPFHHLHHTGNHFKYMLIIFHIKSWAWLPSVSTPPKWRSCLSLKPNSRRRRQYASLTSMIESPVKFPSSSRKAPSCFLDATGLFAFCCSRWQSCGNKRPQSSETLMNTGDSHFS